MNRTILLTAYLMMMTACREKGATAESAVPDIDVTTPVVKDVTLTRFYPGYLSAVSFVDLVARVNGTLLPSHFKAGARVKRGETLFLIEPTIYRNSVEQAAASLKTAEAQLEYARNNYERLKEALLSNAVSHIDVVQAEANMKEAEANVSDARAQLSTAQTNLGYCTIRAPFDGVVSMCNYSDGAYLDGEASPVVLATIYDDSRLYAYFNVAGNQWLAMLLTNPGLRSDALPQQIVVEPGEGGQSYEAKLNYASPDVEQSTGTMLIRADMDNADGLLRSGQYVGVTLPYAEQSDAVLVNASSVGTDQAGSYLYVVGDDNRVRYRHIETGETVDDTLQLVSSGLRPGERYVTKALLKVRDGMKVNPVLSESAK
jgi:RND family efflux transporter MFP subunit